MPKFAEVGWTEMSGCTPVPERDTVEGELVALLITEKLPETLPVVGGVKLTPKERLCPGARVTLPEKPVTAKAVPDTVIWEIVTLPVPVLATESD